MRIDKAIEILECRARDFRPSCDPDERDANKLGIEALKKLKFIREYPWIGFDTLLLGETEE